MSLQLFDGFEALPNLRNSMVVSLPGGGAVTTVTGRDGVGKALSGTGNNAGSNVLLPLPTNQATTVLGVGVKWSSASLGNNSSYASFILMGDNGATSHLCINPDATGHLLLRRGTTSGTVIATSALTITPNSWGYLEVKATINDTTGICIIKYNGVEHINFTGDTRNAGTLPSISAIQLPLAQAGANGCVPDDLYVLDGVDGTTMGQAFAYNDFIGERVIKGARPAANGALSQWLGSDGNSVDNYALVDEDPFNITDYVASSTAGQQDTYDVAAVAGLSSVDAVQEIVYANKTDSGARAIKALSRTSGGTVVKTTDIPLSTTFTVYHAPFWAKDASGNPWTLANVNSHEFGYETV